jgi:monoterpene epsilon-lactone hydrolase
MCKTTSQRADNASAAAAVVGDDNFFKQMCARALPIPTTISPQAQQFLREGAQRIAAGVGQFESPLASDKEGWRIAIAATNAMFDPMIDVLLSSPATVERRTIGGVSVGVGTPNDLQHKGRARLCIHGGAFTVLGGRYVMGDAAQTAAESGCVAYSVDYRMPPDFPYPAAVDDCFAVYRELLKEYEPRQIAISGASAGGNLAAAVTLRIRDAGLPLPGVVGLLTPAVDLSSMGDSWQMNYGVDVMLTMRDRAGGIYVDEREILEPYASPLFADFTGGFPPTFIQSGTRDRLLSDAARMHRALVNADIETELHIWEAMPHGGFGGFSPEDREIRMQFLKFAAKHLVT